MQVAAEETVSQEVPARRGGLFVVSGPSGVGKDAVLERLFARPDVGGVARSVSATTRAPRQGETDGVDYHFLTRAQFEAGAGGGTFLEHAEYGGNLYGTPREGVEAQRARGHDVILKIEVKGADLVRRLAPDAVLVFLAPPSLDVLEARLRKRGTDDEASVRRRLAIAQDELACASRYDYIITNDTLDEAVDALRAVIVAHRFRNPAPAAPLP